MDAPAWLHRRSGLQRAGLCIGLGACAALGQAPFGFWPLSLLALAASFLMLSAALSPRQGALVGWAFGLGYFGLALVWIVEPFLVDLARHGWMAPFALLFMASGLALFWGLAGWGAKRLGGGVLAWIVCLALAELLRSYLFTGFPWAMIGHIWIGTDLALWASVIGPHGLNLLALGASGALYLLWAGGLGQAVFGLAMIAGLWIAAPVVFPSVPLTPDRPMVRLVQPNASQHQKWDPDFLAIFFRRQIEATQAAPRPDLIVWPETSVPVYLEDGNRTLSVMAEAAAGVPMVFGIQRTDDLHVLNAAVYMDSQGEVAQVYDKHHLVPFGEYMPLGDLAARFGIHGLAANEGVGFSAGPGPSLLDLGVLGRALPLICYEAVFPNELNQTADRPQFLLQLTNDAWFGNFSGPYQHLAQARLRTIEQGLPMVRVANTGVSAMIDARGNIVDQLALDETGWLDVALPKPAPVTIYARFGDYIAAGTISFLFLVVFGLRTLRRREIAH